MSARARRACWYAWYAPVDHETASRMRSEARPGCATGTRPHTHTVPAAAPWSAVERTPEVTMEVESRSSCSLAALVPELVLGR